MKMRYVLSEKKNLISTEKGLSLYNVVKDMRIANVELTGKWENALNKIEQGKIEAILFNEEIRKYTKACTKELLDTEIDTSRVNKSSSRRIETVCPKCRGKFLISEKACACLNKENCGFFFWRIVCQRQLTEKDINDILTTGETAGKVRLKKKDGKKFEARLILGDDGKFKFEW